MLGLDQILGAYVMPTAVNEHTSALGVTIKRMDVKTEWVIQWEVTRVRFGVDGNWHRWEYEAVLRGKTPMFGTSTRRHMSLDSLALELASLPRAAGFEFFPSAQEEHEPYVSLSDDSLTQRGRITDEELGELGALVQHYSRQAR